ncbi:hypothetical protein TrRE_jg8432 [Triparma retinervis]|uniref:TLC domain-containing protein n=1 Tax=Triparma retinervis TaxID=2557542 RepID=A0A9W7AJZ1_9STRA|nr:hypothetical protein TrRE_jg8432 [Triparma retinervis]
MFSVPVCFACHSLLWMEGSLGDIAAGTSDYTDGWNWLTMVTMKYTSAYMLQDLLMMLLDEYRYVSDEPYFVSFVLHHTGCLIYLSMVRYYSAGSFSVLILILMGEITNPMQNTINVCLQGIKAGKKWPRKVLSVVNPIFGLGFAVVRLMIAPLFAVLFLDQLIRKKYTGEVTTDIPLGVGALWSLLFLATIHGSFPFAVEKLRAGGFLFWEKGEKGEKGEKKKA